MMDLWSDRADDYRKSSTHAEGADLDLVVEWCEPAAGVTALDVATGGGHVARRLRERGATVVTLDPAPGMQADTLSTSNRSAISLSGSWMSPLTVTSPVTVIAPSMSTLASELVPSTRIGPEK